VIASNTARFGVCSNTLLASGVELGTHAEVKNSPVGGTRLSHFSCVLYSDVSMAVDIGAGAVTCNYDGEEKHGTTIGDRITIGTR
jgi:bifunctional UDP-N-acetylglucosamine pyrophosphorylase/glucosamine-1-phosphate N-acetyltransferase